LKELLIRSVTGLVYGLTLIGSVLIHPLVFLIVYLGITILAVNEFTSLSTRKKTKPQRISSIILSALTFLILFLYHYIELVSVSFLIIPFLVLLIFIIELVRNKPRPFANLSMTFLAFLYVGLPLSLFNEMVFSTYSESYSHQLIVFLFMVLWVNDSGAYLVGKAIGRNKLFERISPKKTWEGLIGGLILAYTVTAIFGPYFDIIPRAHQWFIAGSIVIFGTFGDLAESMWKRSIGIKDSGKVLPGHGGWLDRLDSLLFAVPAVYIITIALNNL
jgi:phosphatidate cytidylyltransferase